MHTGHIVLVEADSAEEAKNIVEGNLSPEEGSSWADWSDWHEIGGRWADEFEGEEDSAVLCYDENPLLAELKVDKFLQHRLTYLESTLKEFDEKGFDVEQALKSYSPESNSLRRSGDWMSVWKLRTSLEIIDDIWSLYSYVYDMTHGSASLEDFRKRCKSAPEKQFLVMVDFHH